MLSAFSSAAAFGTSLPVMSARISSHPMPALVQGKRLLCMYLGQVHRISSPSLAWRHNKTGAGNAPRL